MRLRSIKTDVLALIGKVKLALKPWRRLCVAAYSGAPRPALEMAILEPGISSLQKLNA